MVTHLDIDFGGDEEIFGLEDDIYFGLIVILQAATQSEYRSRRRFDRFKRFL